MGYSFTYPLFRICGARVGCYIHYPTISCDMLKKVESRTGDFNNRQLIAKYRLLTDFKVELHQVMNWFEFVLQLVYYKIFTWFYALCGRRSSVVMTNSSWTAGHIDQLWNLSSRKIFPPCDVSKYTSLPVENRNQGLLISLAQFRPEKNHLDQGILAIT